MSTNEPKVLPVKRLRDKTAKKHADLVSIYQDLKYVLWSTNKAIGLTRQNQIDDLVLQTYWSASLIAYRRCFNSGKRHGLDEHIYEKLPGDPIGAHNYYYEQASKLIAHSVNPFEEVQVGIVVDGDNIVGVSELSAKLVSTSEEGYATLHNLARHSIIYLEQKIEETRLEIEENAKKLSTSEIEQLKTITYKVPEPKASKLSREDQ
jgi:hypothetical protein